jgi:hypothetical protein
VSFLYLKLFLLFCICSIKNAHIIILFLHCFTCRLISDEKYIIILSIKQLIVEIFENMSQLYYKEAYKILNLLPNCLYSTCILTKIGSKNEEKNNDKNYDELKV